MSLVHVYVHVYVHMWVYMYLHALQNLAEYCMAEKFGESSMIYQAKTIQISTYNW